MNLDLPLPGALAATATLLVSGGDERISLDPQSGVSPYGCRAYPDPDLVALGSSTASVISEQGYAAADALRLRCLEEMQYASGNAVYAREIERLRGELLDLCGLSARDGVGAVMAASGTDVSVLVTHWLRPSRIVMIAPTETGSGVAAALQGRHFNGCAAYGGKVAAGTALNEWQGELHTLSPRADDGSLRDPALVDAECALHVGRAAAAGESVLLVLTDASKTGLIVPSIATVIALKQRWPEQVEVLVDACQFRLAPATVRAYLAQGFMLALTGSKFISGPTFCGALIVATGANARYPALLPGLGAYSCAADWPPGWSAARALPQASNFGLLLRWQAALTELRRFDACPDAAVRAFLGDFAAQVRATLAGDASFEAVPVPAFARQALGGAPQWDQQQTIFPFLLFAADGRGARRPLSRDETRKIYLDLLNPPPGSAARKYQLGQPVLCGDRDGVPVSALRICVSARMIAAACAHGGQSSAVADAREALVEIKRALAGL
ncbi:hypothetical protein AAKU55_004484 [Oxalobacteraceae bacterium GrIS 1.11]